MSRRKVSTSIREEVELYNLQVKLAKRKERYYSLLKRVNKLKRLYADRFRRAKERALEITSG